LTLSHWPALTGLDDEKAEAEIGWVVDLVTAVRSLRSEMNIAPATLVPLMLVGASSDTEARAQRWSDIVKRLARLSELSFAKAMPQGAVQLLVRGDTAALPLKGVIDFAAEKVRLEKEVAKADADGYLYIVDRKKDMVLSGGFNIYTKEVEQALLANPDVADAAVIGVPDEIFGEAVAAFIERAQGKNPTVDSVLAHVRDLVAGYKKPKYVFIVDELPRNSLGKVLKRDLRERWTIGLQKSQEAERA